MLLNYVCENCGKTFSASITRGRRPRKRFCSPQCSEAFLHYQVDRVCPVCETTFQVPLGSTGYRTTCSPECAAVWRSKPPAAFESVARLQARGRRARAETRTAACEFCGQDGVVEVAHLAAPAHGDTADPEQQVLLCSVCHAKLEEGLLTAEMIRKRAQRLIDGIRIKRVAFQVDERGRLSEVFSQRDLIWKAPAHIYLTSVEFGVTKGWHLHQLQTDNFFCVYGAIRLGLFDVRAESSTFGLTNDIILSPYNPVVVQIPPGILHGFKGISAPTAMVLNMTDRVYRIEDPDEIRVSAHPGAEQTADLRRLEIPFEAVPFDWTRKDF